MSLNLRRSFFLAAILTLAFQISFSQAKKKDEVVRILFVFDASQSMYGLWEGETKMQVAVRLLNQLVDSLKSQNNVLLALRAFGHMNQVAQGSRNCEDTRLEVPFGKGNHNAIKDKFSSIRPRGTTLIAYSLQMAGGDFPACSNCKNIIILITDGIEECAGDPCLVSMNLQKKGIVLKPFVVGMGLDPSVAEQFRCVGNFFDVHNQSEFRNVLGVIISQAMNTTSVQVNLLDNSGNPKETDAGMTFYDQHSGELRYHFIHALNHRGLPDTLPIDPLGKYRLTVHTIPPVMKDSIEMQAGIHNIIAVDAPQGMLSLQTIGNNEYKDLKVIVRKGGSMETLHIQDFNETVKYIVGKYDLEILTLPRLVVKGVDVLQSHTAKVEIPGPGLLTVTFQGTGVSELYEVKGKSRNLIHRFNINSTRESLVIQPGKYEVGYRPKNARSSSFSKTEAFEITSGQSVQLKF